MNTQVKPPNPNAAKVVEAEVMPPAAGEQDRQLVVAPPTAPEGAQLLAIIDRASRDPKVNVEKLRQLVQMKIEVDTYEAKRQLEFEDRQARKAFSVAMSAAQKAMTPIAADAKNDQTRSNYASYAALDTAVRPIYTEHGFSLSFNSGEGAPADHIRVLCYAEHNAGHSRTYYVDMPCDGKGARGGDVMTKTHAAKSAFTYGQRTLLTLIFNLAIDKDDDGNAAGRTTKEARPKAPNPNAPKSNDTAKPAGPPREPCELKPPAKGMSAQLWADNYVAAVLTADDLSKVKAWEKINDGWLLNLSEKHPDIYNDLVVKVREHSSRLGQATKQAEPVSPARAAIDPSTIKKNLLTEIAGLSEAQLNDFAAARRVYDAKGFLSPADVAEVDLAFMQRSNTLRFTQKAQ